MLLNQYLRWLWLWLDLFSITPITLYLYKLNINSTLVETGDRLSKTVIGWITLISLVLMILNLLCALLLISNSYGYKNLNPFALKKLTKKMTHLSSLTVCLMMSREIIVSYENYSNWFLRSRVLIHEPPVDRNV